MTDPRTLPYVVEYVLDKKTLELRRDSLVFPFVKFGSNETGNVSSRGGDDYITMIIGIIIITFVGLPVNIIMMINIGILSSEIDIYTLIVLTSIIIVCLGTIFLTVVTLKSRARSWSYIRYVIIIGNTELIINDKSVIFRKINDPPNSTDELIQFSLDSQKNLNLERENNSLYVNLLYVENLMLEDKNNYLVRINEKEIEFKFLVSHPNRKYVRFHPEHLIIELS